MVNEKYEDIRVPNTPYNLIDYTHGRCHIFAQALYEELGYEMEFLWDTDYWFEDADCPSIVLVHAYCILPNELNGKEKYVDARGVISKGVIEDEYECNCHLYENYTISRLNIAFQYNVLEKPTISEIRAIREFIRANKKNYQ